MTQEQIIQGCRKGCREAQRELYAQTSDRIYRLLLRMTGDPDSAFDLAQDTFLKVFANIERFEGNSGVITWMYRIAVNEGRQHFRRTKRYDRKLQVLAALPNSQADRETQETSGAVMDVREALAHLPEFERNLIILRHFNSLSYDELAKVLERPAGTIASALNRARRMLRDLLEPKPAREREDSPAPGHL